MRVSLSRLAFPVGVAVGLGVLSVLAPTACTFGVGIGPSGEVRIHYCTNIWGAKAWTGLGASSLAAAAAVLVAVTALRLADRFVRQR